MWNTTAATVDGGSRSVLRFVFFVLGFDGGPDLDGGAESLVVGVADGHAHVDCAGAEVQFVVGARIGREPVVAFDIFAEGFESRKDIFLPSLDDVGDGFAVALDDIQIAVVYPD